MPKKIKNTDKHEPKFKAGEELKKSADQALAECVAAAFHAAPPETRRVAISKKIDSIDSDLRFLKNRYKDLREQMEYMDKDADRLVKDKNLLHSEFLSLNEHAPRAVNSDLMQCAMSESKSPLR